jgi:Fur family ferric uptake transcriptional regulator
MQILELLSDKKLKLTTARKELLKIFYTAHKPLSYEELKYNLNMDKATFYRNISKFEDESIINSFESNDKKRYYELQKKPHSHFICNLCNNIECIHTTNDIYMDGYIIEDVIYKGVCKICNK